MEQNNLTGYPSIDKPWLKYYTEEAINTPIPQCTVYEYLWNNNKDHLNDIAITYFNRNITYSELFQNIDKVAHAFVSIGVKPGDIVTMCTVSTPETIYAFYALSRLGAVSNLIDLRSDAAQLNNYIVAAASRIVLCHDLAADKIQEAVAGTNVEKVIIVSTSDSFHPVKKLFSKVLQAPNVNRKPNMLYWARFLKGNASTSLIPSGASANDLVLMTHTCGPTGVPKCILLSNDNINAVAFQYGLGVPHSRRQKYLAAIPPFIAFSVSVGIHLPLSLGMTCIPIVQFTADKFCEDLKKYSPNHFICTPSSLEALIHNQWELDLRHLSVPCVAGGYINRQFEDKINFYFKWHNCKVKLVKGYGIAGFLACTTKHGFNKYGSVGFPLIKTTIAIFQPGTDQELHYNEEGEICFTGPNMMAGYFKNQAEIHNIMKKHSDGNLWIHSGDIGYMDEDGFLFVIDRTQEEKP